MSKKTKIVLISIIVALSIALTGSGFAICKTAVELSKANKELETNTTSITEKDEKIADLEKQLEESKEQNETIKNELTSANVEKDRLQKENGNLKKEIEKLKANKKAPVKVTVNKKPSQPSLKPLNQKPVDSSSKTKVCYLTFDDGPSSRTKEILDILKKYNVKATFFVINSPESYLMKRIHEEGHAIGLHAYSHNYAQIYKSTDAYFKDLNAISDKVYSLTGVRSPIMRFPGGGSNAVSKQYSKGIMTKLTAEVTKKGYAYFDWNVDSDDAGSSHSSYTRIVNNVINGSKGKNSICVLMHDASSKTSTVQALPYIIEGLSERGYRFEVLTNKTSGFHHSVNN